METGHPTACALLGLPEPPSFYSAGPRPLVELAQTTTGVKATQVSLAVLLGAYEDGTSRNSWRSPTADTVAYFTALRDWHYPLSEVERLVLEPDAAVGDEGECAGESVDDTGDTSEEPGDAEAADSAAQPEPTPSGNTPE